MNRALRRHEQSLLDICSELLGAGISVAPCASADFPAGKSGQTVNFQNLYRCSALKSVKPLSVLQFRHNVVNFEHFSHGILMTLSL